MTTNVQTFSGDIDVSSNLTVGGTLNTTEFGPDIIDVVYPVGTIFITTSSTNPGTYLTGTTWAAYGEGRVLVGLDSGDADFNSPGETGGTSTHSLTTAQLPSHAHDIKQFPGNNQRTDLWLSFLTGQYSALPIRRGGGQANYYRATGDTGSGSGHNIMQPYIVDYLWRRTA
jgi:hypothetical protein